jgi:tetratricopeptide (TPR) repeat protein
MESKSRILAVLVLALLTAVAGCKSKETTSAMLHNDAGRPDLAIETAMQGLEKDPNDAEAYFQLGIAYSMQDSVDLAYKNFQKAAELEPKREEMVNDNIQSNFAKHYNVALNLSRDENLEGAAREFKKATEADPRQAKGHFMLGSAYERLATANDDPSYYPKAIESFDKVLDLSTPADRHYIDALAIEGEVLARMGQPEEAISRFNRLIEEDPTNYRVIEKIGYDLLDRRDWAGAAVFLELAAQARAKIGAEDFNLFYNMGVANFQAGRKQGDQPADLDVLAKAVGFYEQALELQPDEPQTVFNVVVAYSAARDWRQVVAWGEKYVGLDPDNGDAWRLLSRAYTETGNDAKARECASRYESIQRQ